MQLSIYILFDGKCLQALNFYQSIFGGDISYTTVADSPMKNMFPDSLQNRVINGKLNANFIEISASDWLRPNEKPINGNTLCLYISDANAEEITNIFHRLSENAQVTDPLSNQPFGLYGALNDQFGVRWMFHSANKGE